MRCRHYAAFMGKLKNITTKELISCTTEELWIHLEKYFKDGMTRKNHGIVWHVDHIIPLTFFNLLDKTERKLACHYGNLQPLFVQENLSKGDKVPDKTNFRY